MPGHKLLLLQDEDIQELFTVREVQTDEFLQLHVQTDKGEGFEFGEWIVFLVFDRQGDNDSFDRDVMAVDSDNKGDIVLEQVG